MSWHHVTKLVAIVPFTLVVGLAACGGGGGGGSDDPNPNPGPAALSIAVFEAYEVPGNQAYPEAYPIHEEGSIGYVWSVHSDRPYGVDIYYSADNVLSPATDLLVYAETCNDAASPCTQDGETTCSVDATGIVVCDGMASITLSETLRFVFLRVFDVATPTDADQVLRIAAPPTVITVDPPEIVYFLATNPLATFPHVPVNPLPVFQAVQKFSWFGGITGKPSASYDVALYYSQDSDASDPTDTLFFSTTCEDGVGSICPLLMTGNVECLVSPDRKITCGDHAAVQIPDERTVVILEITNPAAPELSATAVIGLLNN